MAAWYRAISTTAGPNPEIVLSNVLTIIKTGYIISLYFSLPAQAWIVAYFIRRCHKGENP